MKKRIEPMGAHVGNLVRLAQFQYKCRELDEQLIEAYGQCVPALRSTFEAIARGETVEIDPEWDHVYGPEGRRD